MKHVDLCSGIGGFALAARWMRWQTVAFCEKDAFCQKVLAKNFPGVPIYDDLFTFPSESFYGCDIATAGLPCQPYSQAGKKEGRNDERFLFPAFFDFVRAAKPQFCVVENVRGLLSIEHGKVFADVIASLEGEGYEVVTFCIPASAVGAPHRRDRLWIVANADNLRQQQQEGSFQKIRRRIGHGYPKFDGWNQNRLEVAAEFCRMDARVSNRVDRLRALGNSIVPQIAFEIFKAIEAAES